MLLVDAGSIVCIGWCGFSGPLSVNEDDTSAFDRAEVAVEPNATADGDNDGTVDIEDPGEAELELVLRCR